MPKPVCIPCQRFFRVKRNGIHVLEGKPIVHGALSGTKEDHNWAPYKMWRADLWQCEGCGATIASGFANNPMWEDFEGALPETLYHKVNDC